MPDIQEVTINRRNSPQLKRSFTLLNAVTSGDYGPAINVGHGFAFFFYIKATGVVGTNRVIIETRDSQNNWATWKDILVPTGNPAVIPVEAIAAVNTIRAKVAPYGGGTFTVTLDVLNVKAIEAGQTPATIDWSALTNKPATFSPASHTHAFSEVTGAAPHVASKAPRPGIVSAGTSAVGTTQDNPGLAFGTSDLTIGMWVRLPDWTPASSVTLWNKIAGTGLYGPRVQVYAVTGVLRLSIGNGDGSNVTDYFSTVATGVADGAWAFISATFDRDGNATFYVNGAQLGAPVSIAAQSAVTWGTGAAGAAMSWMSYQTTQYTAGTLGECWIISGLLSASRIADIYRAGSIAPFCTYTPNATTGQNTATIDGLSFFCWPDFEKADPINFPLAVDKSGNNQHAILGTTGLKALSPPAYVNKAPRAALVSDGSNGSFVRATLTSQNPGTGEAVLLWEGIYPQDATSSTKVLAALTSSTSDVDQAKRLRLGYDSSSGLAVHLTGATTSDARAITSSLLHTQLAALGARGVAAAVVARRSLTGIKVFLGIGRDASRFYDVTNLFVEAVAGTAPAWTDEIDGDYLVGFYRTSTNSSVHTLYDLRLYNVALTEAQLRTEYERGEPGPEWVGATNTSLVPAALSFSLGATDASNTTSASGGAGTLSAEAGARTGGAGGYFIRTTATGASNWNLQALVGGIQPAKSYRLRCWVRTSRAASDYRISLRNNSGSSTTEVALATSTDWQQIDTIVQGASFTPDRVYLREQTTPIVGNTIDLDDLEVVPAGYTTRLRTDTAAGLTALNGAKSATNDASDFLLSTAGITVQPDRDTWRLRIPSMSADGFIYADQVLVPAGWRLVRGAIRRTAGTNTPTVTIKETSSSGTTVASAAIGANEVAFTISNDFAVAGKKLHLSGISGQSVTVDGYLILEKTSAP